MHYISALIDIYRLGTICRFLSGLYSSKYDGSAAPTPVPKTTPPIMDDMKRLRRRRQRSCKAKDLWTYKDDAIFSLL
jgi:hypothetical protein